MKFEKRLFFAKILTTLCVIEYAFVPLVMDFSASNIASSELTPYGRFHLSWSLTNHILALPVLLSVLWSKLHGTARSLRLVALLGLAYTGSFFATMTARPYVGSNFYGRDHAHLILGMGGEVLNMSIIFLVLVISIFLTLGPRN